MADQPVLPAEPARPVRALQRCPNCEARVDVSLFVGGARVRCARCHMRFEVQRPADPPRKRTPLPGVRADDKLADPAFAEQKTVPSDRLAQERAARLDAGWQLPTEVKPAQAPPAAARPQPPAAPAAPPLPHLEGFAVHERVGQGGMGEVFRCTSLKDGRPVAVKVLGASLAVVPDYVKRFEREAAAMAQLSHPGIVSLLSRGRSGPHCWISMELIDGTSLRTWAHQNKPSPRTLAKLLAQVAHALAYAHARGVVHRDLKPDNVLIQPDGKSKVLDFGLAGLYIAGAECLTQSNVAMGTANYMAPEQRKDAKHVDHRADLYSFGVMTYELLTGELPVGRFPPPSKTSPGLDKSWDALIERCLETDPARRPHSALELAHALETLSGIQAPMELAPRTKRKATKSKLWSWIGLGSIAAVAVGLASLRVSQDHERRPKPVPAAARTLARIPQHR